MRLLVGALALLVMLTLSGCGITIPTDPNGSLDRASGGTLRVGISPNGDLAVVDDSGYSGKEVDIVRGFARSIDAEIDWTVGSEEALVRGLETQKLDVVIGGITDQTPWTDRVGLTRPYLQTTADDGASLSVVMLLPMGENALLSELETYLDSQRVDA
ncbi:extracellular solute-binding protein, family 3 [Paramicrobacterium humi]|uniref:Extracellular solute-binding protein, family 3 n=1 Tax=Paramicrobacterium humi TaxID=640635 RepID=A0A1H4JMM9_9MICO|nr:transporter substrate-binding domain-containing protein [Microbacterium humi]SEB47126.1 extracellular solute-binding protein, family 3 [Microbacterium humi]